VETPFKSHTIGQPWWLDVLWVALIVLLILATYVAAKDAAKRFRGR